MTNIDEKRDELLLVAVPYLRAIGKQLNGFIEAADKEIAERYKNEAKWRLRAAQLEREKADAIATKDAELARLREALEVANQFVLEVNHAYAQGPEWYTRGESGLRQHVSMWIYRASKAIQEALRSQ